MSPPSAQRRFGTHRRTDVNGGSDPRREGEPDTLAALLGDLAGQPVPDSRLGRMQARALHLAERMTTWGPAGPLAEVGWRTFRRDQSVAGGVMASALAYRLFVWMLPLALLLVGGLGLLAEASDGDPTTYVEDAGITGYFAESIGDATDSIGGFTRLAVIVSASLVLLYETYVLLRALRAVSALTWRVPVRAMRHPATQTLILLGLLLAIVVAGGLTKRISGVADVPVGWLIALVSLAVAPCFYVLLCMLLLPNGAERWTSHLPGAALFYLMVAAIHLFTALILYPWIARKQETYGVLGVAAGVLLTLYVISRALVISTALNAVLQSDRAGRQAAQPAPSDASGPAGPA